MSETGILNSDTEGIGIFMSLSQIMINNAQYAYMPELIGSGFHGWINLATEEPVEIEDTYTFTATKLVKEAEEVDTLDLSEFTFMFTKIEEVEAPKTLPVVEVGKTYKFKFKDDVLDLFKIPDDELTDEQKTQIETICYNAPNFNMDRIETDPQPGDAFVGLYDYDFMGPHTTLIPEGEGVEQEFFNIGYKDMCGESSLEIGWYKYILLDESYTPIDGPTEITQTIYDIITYKMKVEICSQNIMTVLI